MKKKTHLAITINGEEVDSFPTTAGYVGKVEQEVLPGTVPSDYLA